MNLLFRRIDKYGKKTPIQSGFVESIESWFCRCKHCFYRSLSSPHWIMHSCGRVTYNLSLTAFVVIGYASLLYAWHALIGCTRTGIHFANGKVYWSQKSSIWTGTHSANNGRRVSQLNQMKTTAHLFQNHMVWPMVRFIDFGRRTKTECCLCFDSFFAWSATTTSMKGWVIDFTYMHLKLRHTRFAIVEYNDASPKWILFSLSVFLFCTTTQYCVKCWVMNMKQAGQLSKTYLSRLEPFGVPSGLCMNVSVHSCEKKIALKYEIMFSNKKKCWMNAGNWYKNHEKCGAYFVFVLKAISLVSAH